MPWDVQPYALVSELETRYTESILSGTSRMIRQIAPEMEAWMKQEARWQDRTTEARSSLQARVVEESTTRSNPKYQSGLAVAMQRDAKELAKINRQRTKALTWGGRQPLKSVPKGRSQVAALRERFADLQIIPAKPALIGSIRIGYGDEPHDVKHAIWLEVAFQGRYAIISRTLDYWGPKLESRLKQVRGLVQFEQAAISYTEPLSGKAEFERFVANQNRLFGEGFYKPFDPVVRERYKVRKRRERSIRRQKERTGTFQRKTRSDKGTKRNKY